MSVSDEFLFGPLFECPGDNVGGHFGAIWTILAVRASIWTPRGPKKPLLGDPLDPQAGIKYNLVVSMDPFWVSSGDRFAPNQGKKLKSRRSGGPLVQVLG